jgi:hypothetical protein
MSGHHHCTQSSNPSTSKKARIAKDGTIKSLFSNRGGNVETLKLSHSGKCILLEAKNIYDHGRIPHGEGNIYFFTDSPASMKMALLLLLNMKANLF